MDYRLTNPGTEHKPTELHNENNEPLLEMYTVLFNIHNIMNIFLCPASSCFVKSA